MSIWGGEGGGGKGDLKKKKGLSAMTLQSARVREGEKKREKGGRRRNPHQDVGFFFFSSLD